MKYITIAPMGEDIENLFAGLKEFPSKHVILLGKEEQREKVETIKEKLKDTNVSFIPLEDNVWESLFAEVSKLTQGQKPEDMVVNTSTGNSMLQCAATSAAFVNGLKAISVDKHEVMLLPVLKFSYYSMLTDKKMRILKELADEQCCNTLEELGNRLKMSLPLVSYHVNGNLKSEGLKTLGLVETMEEKGKVSIRISMLGRLLLKGYIPQKEG